MEKVKIIELNDTNTCKICDNGLGKYTCPRCNILYCSVECYRSNSHIQCSENFYQKCVMEELSTEENDESKVKMLEILKRFHEQQNNDDTNFEIDSDDDEDLPELAERLENIDLNDAESIWEHLTADEKQEFEALVNSNDVSKIIPEWKPWWEFKIKNKLVQEIKKNEIEESNYTVNCPSIFKNIKEFNQISKIKPSECVKYNLLNIISAYVIVVRYYNGDHFDFSNESIYLITNLSKNLLSNQNFETFTQALESVHQQTLTNDWITIDAESKIKMYQDVENILQGPEINNKNYYLKSALSDLHNLLLQSLKKNIKNKNKFCEKFQDNFLPDDKIVSKDKVKILLKKIEYFLSFVNSEYCLF